MSAVVINGAMQDHCASLFLETLRHMPEVRLVVVGEGPLTRGPRLPDIQVESFAPPKLLKALQDLFFTETRQLQEHETDLERNHL